MCVFASVYVCDKRTHTRAHSQTHDTNTHTHTRRPRALKRYYVCEVIEFEINNRLTISSATARSRTCLRLLCKHTLAHNTHTHTHIHARTRACTTYITRRDALAVCTRSQQLTLFFPPSSVPVRRARLCVCVCVLQECVLAVVVAEFGHRHPHYECARTHAHRVSCALRRRIPFDFVKLMPSSRHHHSILHTRLLSLQRHRIYGAYIIYGY